MNNEDASGSLKPCGNSKLFIQARFSLIGAVQ